MSKRKNIKDEPSKLNVERWINVLAIIVGLVALFFAWQANQMAEKANQLSQRAQSPLLSVQHLFSYRAYSDDFKRPCLLSGQFSDLFPAGSATWKVEYALALDVSNVGGQGTALVDIKGGKVESFVNGIDVRMEYDFFGTRESFDKWLGVRPSPSSIFGSEQTSMKLDFSGLPMNFPSGETRRLLIKGTESASFAKELTPEVIQKSMLDVNWNSPITFIFSDGSTKQILVPLTRPYQFDPQNLSVRPFEPCQ